MATPTLERRLAAVWFADIADFTRLSASDEPMAYRVMEAMRQSVRRAVEANGGELVKFLGDGALAHFPSAEGAVEAALQVHRRFRASTRLLPGPQALRVGVHLGEVSVGPDGDLFGDGVNRAARLQEMAEPGQVLVSQAVRELLRQRPELVFTSKGRRTAKGLDEPIHVFEARARGNLSDRLEAVERSTTPVSPSHGSRSRLAQHPGAVATGIAAGILAFAGLGIYTAWGGVPESPPAPDVSSPLLPVADSLPGDGPLPRWPVMAAALVPEPEPDTVAAPPPPPTPAQELRAMASRANIRLRRIPVDEAGWHETLPLLQRGVDEALSGSPAGGRLEVLRGLILYLDRWDFAGAERAFQAALDEDPASPSTRRLYAQLLTSLGRPGEALYQLQSVSGAAAEAPAIRLQRGATFLRSGRPREAERELRRVVDAQPSADAPRVLLARALVARGRPQDAGELLAKGTPSLPSALWRAYAQIRQGGQVGENARAGLPGLVRAAENLPEGSYLLAQLLAAAGEDERAFEYLDRAISARSSSVVWLAVDPEWERFRGDPRYQQRLRRVGLAP